MISQFPPCGDHIQKWVGDFITISLNVNPPLQGKAFLRTNIGHADILRQEIIDETEQGITHLACDWHDIPMVDMGSGKYECTVPLKEVGYFSGKCFFLPKNEKVLQWPDGDNLHIKVAPIQTRKANSIYNVFIRQFAQALTENPENANGVKEALRFLDDKGFHVIPPSGTFRDVIKKLDHIIDRMGFNIIQVLPPFPTPVTYARMGRYGCPFAATDFFSVDPSLAEFDKKTTPLDQFIELIDAIHAKRGRIFIDIPANHTGWASTIQIHHPDWFERNCDGSFKSPGAWGVVWEDLVALDYTNPELRSYMADVFLFWCKNGVDGFRCDAGYMIPLETWRYIIAKVRTQFPNTIFMLEGLGGKLSVTDALLSEGGMDWAYSEIFQTYDRKAFEWYLPDAIKRSEKLGALVHFAETHDNNRLAENGEAYACLRVQLAALLSHQGAWGIANGVEWFASEKIDVHGASSLNWGNQRNMVDLIAKLNNLLKSHPSFAPEGKLELITQGGGNCIAALRTNETYGETSSILILANLDCQNPCTVYWDGRKYLDASAKDLIGNRSLSIDANMGVWLHPGEVLCIGHNVSYENTPSPDETCENAYTPTWKYPEDSRRQFVIAENSRFKISSPSHFNATLINSKDETIGCIREEKEGYLRVPEYVGDGTRANRYKLKFTIYNKDNIAHSISEIIVPPDSSKAKVKLVASRQDIQRDPTLKTVLSNGAGADSQVNAAWGTISSQYDSLFSANTNPNVPTDRLVLWSRCRIWLQHEGYSRELNSQCIESFRADPQGRFAKWIFAVPCGMGKQVKFEIVLSLARHKNAVRLLIKRAKGASKDFSESVKLVFRPDIEWRSFHSVTKAYDGTELTFGSANAISVKDDGFIFSPYGGESFELTIHGGLYHNEALWSYGITHPEEIERCQEPSGDIFSPGWMEAVFSKGTEVEIIGKYTRKNEYPLSVVSSEFEYDIPCEDSLPLSAALRDSLELFMVKRDNLKTVIAGYPWFLDWGRDTLIFLRGAIAAGKIEDSLKILTQFAKFEENGTIPNIIYGDSAGNRDTSDAQLWLIIAVRDLIENAGLDAKKLLATNCGSRKLSDVLLSIINHYISGTPNGILVDRETALVWSPSHFTWMDTNYPAGTPRVGYPVEIESLWIASLNFASKYLDKSLCELAKKATSSFIRLFTLENGGLADCLRAPNGESAINAIKEDAIRPNQLFALSLNVLPEEETALAHSIIRSCEQLVIPGGIRSLADKRTECDMSIWDNGRCIVDAHYPYHGKYTGDENTSRKPAYHNGTVWAWPFPMFAEALEKYSIAPKETSLAILASAVENINTWCLCHISEIADGDAPHGQKGCRAQAWSASELYRVWKLLSEKD